MLHRSQLFSSSGSWLTLVALARALAKSSLAPLDEISVVISPRAPKLTTVKSKHALQCAVRAELLTPMTPTMIGATFYGIRRVSLKKSLFRGNFCCLASNIHDPESEHWQLDRTQKNKPTEDLTPSNIHGCPITLGARGLFWKSSTAARVRRHISMLSKRFQSLKQAGKSGWRSALVGVGFSLSSFSWSLGPELTRRKIPSRYGP